MVTSEPFVHDWLSETRTPYWSLYALAILGTLGIAWLANRRKESFTAKAQ